MGPEARRLAEAIAAGEQPAAVVDLIREGEAELRRVEARLAEAPAEAPDRDALRAALRRQAGDWRAALRSNPVVARFLISKLLDPIPVEGTEASDHVLRWATKARTGAVLSGVLPSASTRACAAPGGSSGGPPPRAGPDRLAP